MEIPMNERFLLYQRSNLTLGFSYEEIPIFYYT